MSRVIRLGILGVVAVLLIFLGRNKLTTTGLVTTAYSQPIQVQLQPTPTLMPTPVVTPTLEYLVPVTSLAAANGLIWDDLNGDGLQSVDEPGIENVSVNLLDSAGAIVATALTDSNGVYQFKDMTPGVYSVKITAPPDYVFSPQNQGANELVDNDVADNSQTTQVLLLAGDNSLVWTAGLYQPTAALEPKPGSVQPPSEAEVELCTTGNFSLGGVSVVAIDQLGPDYCVRVFLWRPVVDIAPIPLNVGDILSDVTFQEVYHQDIFTQKYDAPDQQEPIKVCYAVPLGKSGQIYFLDFYSPHFEPQAAKAKWVPLETTVENGIACAESGTSGGYTLIGK
jgi:hypothetical protein